MASLYDIPVNAIDGSPTSLRAFKGNVLLVVNVASECGLTPQYAQLQQLHARFGGRGLTILGFPANEFGAQEPGTNKQIADFCAMKFGVSFPMFEKIVVKGDKIHPLYKELIEEQPRAAGNVDAFRADLAKYGFESGGPEEVTWNFEKFLVDRHGVAVARFSPDMKPDDPAIVAAIEQALAQ